MQNVVLIIHLLLAVSLIAIVLLQRSEGGGLGIGGGAVSGRPAATALTKLTWALAVAFICTSISLTILNTASTTGGSVLDNLAPSAEGAATGAEILPPTADDGGSLLPVAE